jgi:predicted RNA-binding protein YlxR (DUF448 family)
MAGGLKPRRVPQRTCVGCREVNAKRELVRVVRGADGLVAIDLTGRKNGRGAYVHKVASCIESALKKRGIDHALKVALDDARRQALAAELMALPGVQSVVAGES